MGSDAEPGPRYQGVEITTQNDVRLVTFIFRLSLTFILWVWTRPRRLLWIIFDYELKDVGVSNEQGTFGVHKHAYREG